MLPCYFQLVCPRCGASKRPRLKRIMPDLLLSRSAHNAESADLTTDPVASARARARVGTVTTMAATATPNPPTGVSLIELALGAGYAFADQRWRMSAACAGVDPEVFLPARRAAGVLPPL